MCSRILPCGKYIGHHYGWIVLIDPKWCAAVVRQGERADPRLFDFINYLGMFHGREMMNSINVRKDDNWKNIPDILFYRDYPNGDFASDDEDEGDNQKSPSKVSKTDVRFYYAKSGDVYRTAKQTRDILADDLSRKDLNDEMTEYIAAMETSDDKVSWTRGRETVGSLMTT